MREYLAILLKFKDPAGNLISFNYSGIGDNEIAVTATLHEGESLSASRPYLCAATFEVYCHPESIKICSYDIDIIPPEAGQCQYPHYDDDQEKGRKQGETLGFQSYKPI